jgi:hypothetical protein
MVRALTGDWNTWLLLVQVMRGSLDDQMPIGVRHANLSLSCHPDDTNKAIIMVSLVNIGFDRPQSESPGHTPRFFQLKSRRKLLVNRLFIPHEAKARGVLVRTRSRRNVYRERGLSHGAKETASSV